MAGFLFFICCYFLLCNVYLFAVHFRGGESHFGKKEVDAIEALDEFFVGVVAYMNVASMQPLHQAKHRIGVFMVFSKAIEVATGEESFKQVLDRAMEILFMTNTLQKGNIFHRSFDASINQAIGYILIQKDLNHSRTRRLGHTHPLRGSTRSRSSRRLDLLWNGGDTSRATGLRSESGHDYVSQTWVSRFYYLSAASLHAGNLFNFLWTCMRIWWGSPSLGANLKMHKST